MIKATLKSLRPIPALHTLNPNARVRAKPWHVRLFDTDHLNPLDMTVPQKIVHSIKHSFYVIIVFTGLSAMTYSFYMLSDDVKRQEHIDCITLEIAELLKNDSRIISHIGQFKVGDVVVRNRTRAVEYQYEGNTLFLGFWITGHQRARVHVEMNDDYPTQNTLDPKSIADKIKLLYVDLPNGYNDIKRTIIIDNRQVEPVQRKGWFGLNLSRWKVN
jgi:hypothetical protein